MFFLEVSEIVALQERLFYFATKYFFFRSQLAKYSYINYVLII